MSPASSNCLPFETVGAKDKTSKKREGRDLEPLRVREFAVAGVERVTDQLERHIFVAGHQLRSLADASKVEKNTKEIN